MDIRTTPLQIVPNKIILNVLCQEEVAREKKRVRLRIGRYRRCRNGGGWESARAGLHWNREGVRSVDVQKKVAICIW